jgi:hypothetical protein
MATLGQTPEGLVARDDLPRPDSLPIGVWSRADLAADVAGQVARDLRRLLATSPPAQYPPLAQGA